MMEGKNYMELPKVSVIVAVYGNKEYLPDAIQSALAQDYPNLDVWICDDCSTEEIMPELPINTSSVPYHRELFRNDEIEKFEWKYATAKPLHYIRLKTNGGPSRARNIAIANAMANGSHLIQILDSDDVMHPTKVAELARPIILDPERVAISYADYHIIRDNGTVHYESKPVYDLFRLMNGDCMIHSGALVHSLAIKDRFPYFYEEDMLTCEDYYLWKYILRQHWVAYHIPKPLTYVRSHNNSSVNYRSKEIWERNYAKCMQLR